MIFRFIYEPSEYRRIIQAVNIDNRINIPAIKNAIGSVIKSYIDAETAKIVDRVLFYKIETTDGVLSGYFSLYIRISGACTIMQYVVCPVFSMFDQQIATQLSQFISNGEYKADYLF